MMLTEQSENISTEQLLICRFSREVGQRNLSYPVTLMLEMIKPFHRIAGSCIDLCTPVGQRLLPEWWQAVVVISGNRELYDLFIKELRNN